MRWLVPALLLLAVLVVPVVLISSGPARAQAGSGSAGDVVTLKTAHGRFVVAEPDGNARANRERAGPWEMWTRIDHGGGVVSFRGHHGKYLVAEPDGRANANREAIGPWEKWAMTTHADGTVSFKGAHGKYLVAESNGELNANRAAIGPWERFVMSAASAPSGAAAALPPTIQGGVPAPLNQYAYFQDVSSGHYMTAVPPARAGLPGALQLSPFDAGFDQLFKVTDLGGGKVSIESRTQARHVLTTSRTNYSSDAEYRQPGLPLWLYEWLNGGNQSWRLEKLRDEGEVGIYLIQNVHSRHYVGLDASGWVEHSRRETARQWRVHAADSPPRPQPGDLKAVYLEPLDHHEQTVALRERGEVVVDRKRGFHTWGQEQKDLRQHFMAYPLHDGTTVIVSADGQHALRHSQRADGSYTVSSRPLSFDASQRFRLRPGPGRDDSFVIEVPGSDRIVAVQRGANGLELTLAPRGPVAQRFGFVDARWVARFFAGSSGVIQNDMVPEAIQVLWSARGDGPLAVSFDGTIDVKWPNSPRHETRQVQSNFHLGGTYATEGQTVRSTIGSFRPGAFSRATVGIRPWGGTQVRWFRVLGAPVVPWMSGRDNWFFMMNNGRISRTADGGFALKLPSCKVACWKGSAAPTGMKCLGALCGKDEQEIAARISYQAMAIAELGANVVSFGAGRIGASTARKTTFSIVRDGIGDISKEAATQGFEALTGPAVSHLETAIINELGFLEGNLLAAALNADPSGIYNVVRAFYLPSCDCR